MNIIICIFYIRYIFSSPFLIRLSYLALCKRRLLDPRVYRIHPDVECMSAHCTRGKYSSFQVHPRRAVFYSGAGQIDVVIAGASSLFHTPCSLVRMGLVRDWKYRP